MATSKTLAPTNVTISIPAMTDAPNASVLSNCIDKEADAINTLNSQMATKANIQKGNIAGGASETIAITRPAFVSVGRASNTATSTTAFIDGWGITYLSNNTGAFTLSMSDNNLTISNLSGGYCSYIVVF